MVDKMVQVCFHRNLTIMHYRLGWYSRWWTRWYRYVSIEISPLCTTSGGGAIWRVQGGAGMFHRNLTIMYYQWGGGAIWSVQGGAGMFP